MEFFCVNITLIRIITSSHSLLQLSPPFTLSASLNLSLSLVLLSFFFFFALQRFDSLLQRGLVPPSQL